MKKNKRGKKPLGLLFPAVFGLIGGGVSSILILLAYIFPQYLQGGLLMGLFSASLFILFGVSGYFAQLTHKKDFFAGLKGGAVTAFTAFIIIFAAFFIFENLFFEMVSSRPGMISGFYSSGCETMREFVNLNVLRTTVFALPLGTLFGSAMGMFGGLITKV